MITRRGVLAGAAAMAGALTLGTVPGGSVPGVAPSGSVWGRLVCLLPGAERWLGGDYPSGHMDALLADAIGVGRLIGPVEVTYTEDTHYAVSVGSWGPMREEFRTILQVAERMRLGVQAGEHESQWLRSEYGERPDMLLAAVHPEWVFAFRLDYHWEASIVGGRLHRLRVDLGERSWLIPRGVGV